MVERVFFSDLVAASTSSEWKSKVGASLAPKRPIGREANGNDGVAKLERAEWFDWIS
jgi:hypothetical protein